MPPNLPLPSAALTASPNPDGFQKRKKRQKKDARFLLPVIEVMMIDRCDGVVFGASASQLVGLGFISQLKSYQKTLKMVFTGSQLDAQQNRNSVENKPASLLVVHGQDT